MNKIVFVSLYNAAVVCYLGGKCIDILVIKYTTLAKYQEGFHSLKTRGRQFDNFDVTGGNRNWRNGNLRCHQWRQSSQIDDLCFQCIKKAYFQIQKFPFIYVTS